MSNEMDLTIFGQHEYDGHELTTYFYKDQPVWVALEVGQWLAYGSNGRSLVDQLSDEWRDEFEEGTHRVILKGVELAQFKELVGEYLTSKAGSLTLLTKQGMWLVATLTRKPFGKAFRRFLSTDLMPTLDAQGYYQLSARQQRQNDSKLLAKAASDVQAWLAMAEVYQHPDHKKLQDATAYAEQLNGIDLSHFLNASPVMQYIEPADQFFTITDLTERFQLKRGQLNQALTNYGLQYEVAPNQWEATARALSEGWLRRAAWSVKHESGVRKEGYHLQWRLDIVTRVVEWMRKTAQAS